MEQGSALAKFMQNTTEGRGEIVFSAEQDGGAGVEGTGSVAVVEFQANVAGTASIGVKVAEAFQVNGDADSRHDRGEAPVDDRALATRFN